MKRFALLNVGPFIDKIPMLPRTVADLVDEAGLPKDLSRAEKSFSLDATEIRVLKPSSVIAQTDSEMKDKAKLKVKILVSLLQSIE
ncbi:MAG: hypothetical protein EOP04_29715 [Proteobacteria bacterium]|nr:MAG: hypothetical protein EOP04_29715 [Pseudomonadota bacterium]